MTSSPGSPSCTSADSAIAMRARCCWPTYPAPWTPAFATRSSRKVTATRSPCSSCRARGTSPVFAGGFGLPSRQPVAGKIEQSYIQRLRLLPSDTQLLVLTAAAEPLGDLVLLHRAAGTLGIDIAAAGPAQDGGLLELGARVEFAHPLVRSAAYRSAAADDRHRVHRALADATVGETDPDRRAWHRARATPGPDEEVAAELERSAGRAQARGGVAAAAAFLRRSVELTVDPARRAERVLAAAQVELPGRRVRRGAPAGCHGRGRAIRRVPACPGRPGTRPRRLRFGFTQRCSAVAPEGREAVRAVRPRARA